jgi:hypothetical protein
MHECNVVVRLGRLINFLLKEVIMCIYSYFAQCKSQSQEVDLVEYKTAGE